MRRDPILVVLVACLCASTPGFSRTEPHEVEVIGTVLDRSPDEKLPDLKAVTELLVERTNAFRKREKRAGLIANEKLMTTARYFAQYKAQTDRFGHTADGYDPGIRVAAHGYEFSLLSENIAYCFHTNGFTTKGLGDKLDQGWKESPGHRANMLDPDVTEIGVAVARGGKTGYYYAVQLFGRPSSRSVRVEIANRTDSTLTYRFADQPFSLQPNDGRFHEQGRSTDLIFEFRVGGKPATRSTRILEGKSRIIASESDGVVSFAKD